MRNDQRMGEHHEAEVWKGLVAGLFAGLVASWTMTQFQALWSSLAEKNGGEPENGGDGATVKAAEAITEGVFDRRLTKSEKRVAGPAVHYAMGATSGAIYGAMAELMPVVTFGAGLPFGTAVWFVADEVAVPAFGLSKGPTEVPPSTHVYALASHFVYGVTTEIVRRAVR